MEKTVSIYFIKNKYYLIPTASLNGTFSVLIEPILVVSNEDSLEKIGLILRESIQNCRVEDPSKLEGAFKQFLQISKIRSHKQLIEEALYMRAEIKNDTIVTIRRIGANKKYKAYMVDLGIPPVHLDLNTPNEAIGLAIRQLFSADGEKNNT